MSVAAPDTVEFWFDPICPWTWITSRWIAEVAARRDFEVTWHPFSLQVLNEGNAEASHVEAMREGHQLGRVMVAVAEAHGSEGVGRLYDAVGTRRHPGGREDFDAVLTESLAEAGLPASLAEAAADDSRDAALRASTRRGIELVGPGVGIPIIAIDGVAFFGPVISPAPTGDDALTLWDGVRAAASIPGFFELKRGREVGPQF